MPAKAMFLSYLDISLSEDLVRIYFGLFSYFALLAIRDPELSVRARLVSGRAGLCSFGYPEFPGQT